ncbi:hypothetical protein [uncultured Aquimarina sp.]|uniref:hypothetical protein n=1 Tax=uncultured Aquimarina sp. TaxID=575652 RepID=UPI00260B5F8D|nr:hypothetical protein [uncultured Aquimarina sp.]
MKTSNFTNGLLSLMLLSIFFYSCSDETEVIPNEGISDASTVSDSSINLEAAMAEMESLTQLRTSEMEISETEKAQSAKRTFPAEFNVFLKSAIALNNLEDPDRANVTLPLFKGKRPNGRPAYFILTETSNFNVAKLFGINYAPKLINAIGTGGEQYVTINRGRIQFAGDIDFSPERILEPGIESTFPPSVAEPGAIGDDEWSSIVVLPSGLVLNAMVIANSTGLHDRVISISRRRGHVKLQLLDGFQGGDQFYYHLVTDSSDRGAATIELGVYAPRLANFSDSFGQSTLFEPSPLLGFSPNINGLTGIGNPNRQGLNSTILDDDLDPINVFPIDPDNDLQFGNNYSPLWDAHLSQWTDKAIDTDQRRRIVSFDDLDNLISDGLIESFAGSAGIENDFVVGLRASEAIINCPVICQPFEGSN